MSELTRARKNKMAYAEIKFDNNSLVDGKDKHEFTRSFGKFERRISLTADESALLHTRVEAAIDEIYAKKKAEGRRRVGDNSTIMLEAPKT